MSIDTLPGGGPAFPCDPFIASRPGHESVAKRLAEGMTLRDHFATAAMQGLIINSDGASLTYAQRAEWAYKQADAMLEARQ